MNYLLMYCFPIFVGWVAYEGYTYWKEVCKGINEQEKKEG